MLLKPNKLLNTRICKSFKNFCVTPINTYNPMKHTLQESITVSQNLKSFQNSFTMFNKIDKNIVLLNPVLEDIDEYQQIAERYDSPIASIVFFNLGEKQVDFVEKICKVIINNFSWIFLRFLLIQDIFAKTNEFV